MAKQSLTNIQKAYDILKEYKGNNPLIISLKNSVFAYKTKSLNDFDVEFILRNHDKEPKYIGKIVKVADWWGEVKKEEWGTEFVPEKIQIGWYIGDTESTYVFYCRYRRSIKEGILTFANKKAILTDFLTEDFNSLEVDFKPYNERSGRDLFPQQEEAVKFLLSRKKAILAIGMGGGKTFSAIVAAIEGKYKHILIISPASVKTTWHRELSKLVPEEDITIVNGSKWNDAKFTILNYEILKNFYEVPTEIVKKSELDLDENGNLIKTYKEKEVVSRKTSVISKAMSNSQLFQSDFDLIIIDEAHRLSNTTSGIYKIVSDLVKRSNPEGIFELTGTPITNDNKNLYNLLKIIGHPITNDWEHYMKRYCGAKTFYNKKERDAISHIFIRNHGKSSWYDLSYEEKEELNEVLEKKCKKIWTFPEATNSDELQEIIKTCYLKREKDEFVPLPPKTINLIKHKLTKKESEEYSKIWEDYISDKEAEGNSENSEKYKAIIEGSVLRQWLADAMLRHTIKLAKKIIAKGEKVIIFCSFDHEIDELREEFGDICVYHNGKLTAKRKDNAVDSFQNDDNIKVFIGNLQSAGVGITLTSSQNVIFNSISFVPGDNWQAEDRCHRIGQTKPCNIWYQTLTGTYLDHMMEIIAGKSENINTVIINEKEK
jgi:SWI/SNF-related matrix-associated actin-dependent regulator 1 of chromatin subfamily A